MNGAGLFLKILKDRGIETIYGIVGREAETILFNEIKGIDFMLTRDERNAAFMADIQGRLTNKVGVCYSTFGPGASNLITGVASAYMDRSPVLAISAQVEKRTIHHSTHQCLNQVELMRPVTKYSKEIYKIKDLAKELIKAIEIAERGLPGPSFISIPLDIFKEEARGISISGIEDKIISDQLSKDKRLKTQRTEKKGIGDLIKLISAGTFPIFIIGSGVYRSCNIDYLNKTINSLKAPFLATYAANGVISHKNNNYLGTVSKYLDDFAPGILKEIFGHADPIVLIGVDMVEGIAPELWESGGKKNICAINSILNSSYRVRADISVSYDYFWEILSRVMANKPIDIKNVIKIKNKITLIKNEIIERQFAKGINPFKVADVLNKQLREDDILISDVGIHKQIVSLFYNAKKPNAFFCSNGLGTMGFALPAAIGAKKTFPKKRVIAVCGDGGFYSSSNELESSIRYKLPVICIIFSDASFGLIRHYQNKGFHRFNTGITNFGRINFVKLAEANGCEGYRVNNIAEMQNILQKKLDTNRTVLIEIPLVRQKYL